MTLRVHCQSMAVSPTDSTALHVLVIDDEASLRHLLRMILERSGFGVLEAGNAQEGLALLEAHPDVRVVMCDIRMPVMDGLAFLEAVAGRDLRVVMMSAYGTTDTAMECLRRGAHDYITKPFRIDEIRICMERIVERERLLDENRVLREQIRRQHTLQGFIGRSDRARAVMEMVRKVAAYPTTVLFAGESGTGKELMANALHTLSPRAEQPFVPINCAALPESLLESELFGHEKGAFTGADKLRKGRFELADGGTLLLDEISEIPPELQAKLLRVLQERTFERVGSSQTLTVDVRVVATTNRDLATEVDAGRFGSAILDPLEDRADCELAHPGAVLVDRGQRHVGEGSDEGVVVADHGNVVGNVKSGRVECAQRAGGDQVVEGEDGGGDPVGLDKFGHG